MKKIVVWVLGMTLMLAGCSSDDRKMEQILDFRDRVQNSSCSFEAKITADYGERLYTLTVDCTAETSGRVVFSVVEPESIAGITGYLSDDGGHLTFDDEVLAFPLLTEKQLSPVSTPWILMRALKGGYIRALADTDEGVKVILSDSYEEESLQIDLWFDENLVPKEAEVLWQNRRILSIEFENFALQ